MGLNPRLNALLKNRLNLPKRIAYLQAANLLDPPYPYRIQPVPLNFFFSVDDPDPSKAS